MSSHGGGWANPSPAGLVALAIACFTFFAVLTGRVEHSCVPLLGCWLIGGALVQFTVAVIELKEGATLGGNVFLFFSAFFMLTGGLEFFVKSYLSTVHGAPIDARIDGWAWMVLWFALWLWSYGYFKSPLWPAIILLDIAVPIVSLNDLKVLGDAAATWVPIAGWALFLTGIYALYVASCVVLNTEFGRTVLPVPGTLIKPAPVQKSVQG